MDAQTSGRWIAARLLRMALGFRDAPQEATDELVAAGLVRTLGKGEALVERGEPFDRLGLVIEGALQAGVLLPSGRRSLVAFLNPGDLAGLMSLLDHLPHPNDLVARESGTRVLVVAGADYRRTRDRHPSISHAVELQLAYRSRLLSERVVADSTMALEIRLARQLHLMATLSGRTQDDNAPQAMRISQADLGDCLGVSRPRANFAAQQLKREGLIGLNYSTVTILDPAGLARRAGL